MISFQGLILLCFAGCIGGFMNTIASSGSAITLPSMLILGIPPSIANATNRLPIFMGSCTSVYTYNQTGLFQWKKSVQLLIPWISGTVTGILLTKLFSVVNLQKVILLALIFAFFLLISNSRSMLKARSVLHKRMSLKNYIVFFLIGVWAGLVVLDCATLILFELILGCGMDLRNANPIKNFLLLLLSLISVVIFSTSHSINWIAGGALGIGSILGSRIASKLANNNQVKNWAFRFLVIITGLEVIHFLLKLYFHIDVFPIDRGNASMFKL